MLHACVPALLLTAAAQSWPPADAPETSAPAPKPAETTPWGTPPPPPAASEAPPAAQAPDTAPPEDSGPLSPWEIVESSVAVRIVYTGDLGGVGSGHYSWESLRRLREPQVQSALPVSGAQATRGVLAQDDWLLLAPDGRVQTALAPTEGAAPTCTPADPVTLVEIDAERMVVPSAATRAAFEALTRHADAVLSHKSWTCTTSAGVTTTLVGPAGLPLPSWEVEDWEFRAALQLRSDAAPGGVTVVGRPLQETARMFERIAALSERSDVLYVDAGSFVDGASSVASGQLSRHRPLGYAMLQRLQPAALVPGATELVAGPSVFLQEARAAFPDAEQRYIATNWTSDDPLLQLAKSRVVTVDTPGGPRKIAFVGVLDPGLANWIPALEAEGVTLTDPVLSVQKVVDELIASEHPDAIVALTAANGPLLADLRRRLRGVAVMAGDSSFATLRVEQREVALRPVAADDKAAPLTVSLDGVAALDLLFDPDGLTRVRTTPARIGPDLEPDAAVQAAIMRTRKEAYPGLDVPLLPAPGTSPLDTWSRSDWDQLVCEAVRAQTNAHSVFLRELPKPPEVPGPLTRLEAMDHLAMLDELIEVRVPGDDLKRVLDQALRDTPVVCGAQSPFPKPDGRLIDPQRVYRIVTTDRTAHGTPLDDVLNSVRVRGPLDPPIRRKVVDDQGAPLTIARAFLGGISQADRTRAEDGTVVTELLERRAAAYPNLWLLRFREVSGQLVRFNGVDNNVFAEVPETLATNPSSVTLTAEWDAALENSGAATLWDLRARGTYSTLQTDAEDPPIPLDQAETADDVRWSTSLAIPAWTVALNPGADNVLGFMPYTEALYDTELTATYNDTGTQNPLQRDLSLTVGVSAGRVGMLRTLRIGAFGNRDLTLLDEKPTEYGGKVELATWKRLAGSFTWTVTADLQVWANTPDDDASDLRFRFFGDTRLGMPLTRWLSFSPFVQAFALQGRTPATNEVGLAWTGGAALDLTGAFRIDSP